MTGSEIPLEQLLTYLEDLAQDALILWEIPNDAKVRLINVSENTTYLVEGCGGYKAVLRVHRADYHSKRAIECELAWLDALASEKVAVTPGYYVGRNGSVIQSRSHPKLSAPRFLVLFEFLEGDAPDETGDMVPGYEALGAIAARCHDHALSWHRPEPFERLVWDTETVFGKAATWGNWRDAPHVTEDIKAILEAVEKSVCARLHRYGKAPDRFNLIHADMRLANLLVDETGTRLIDFDDCGFGWFMYDFAAAVSFIEDDPRIPAFKQAWVKGYRSVRSLSKTDEAEIDTFIMLRRMALLAWIGSHIEAPEPQALAPDFATNTAKLGQAWLNQLS